MSIAETRRSWRSQGAPPQWNLSREQKDLREDPRASRISYSEADQATLLGLFHGYDQARLSLAKLVSRFGTDAPTNEETQRRIFSRTRRLGIAADLFMPPSQLDGNIEGLNQGAHSATLSAFAAVSEQAEELLRALRKRWPDLCEDAGGPLPVPSSDWDD